MSAFRVLAVITTICCMMVSTYASSVYGVCRCMCFYQCNREELHEIHPGSCVKSPVSLNVSAPSHLFPPQVASKRSALVLLLGIYSSCLFIPLSPTQDPILVTCSQLKLFTHTTAPYTFATDSYKLLIKKESP